MSIQPVSLSGKMPEYLEEVSGSITAPSGYRAAGIACGLKKNKQPDLALIVSDVPAQTAGVFTKNVVKGHSLQLTRRQIAAGQACAIVINSGNANACVGDIGLADAESMAAQVAAWLRCPAGQVLTGSTGVIGQRLDMTAVSRGIGLACERLSQAEEAGHNAERAIMTTDTKPKECVVRLPLGGKTITIAGMAKGSGMIHPDMATMIAILTTDCAIDHSRLQVLLRLAVDPTFNRVSVDGDTSVCDMVVVLANGMAGNAAPAPDSEDERKLLEAFTYVCYTLARQIAADGEGATKLIDIRVEGARDATDACKIVQAVARSPLVKTALYGEDANWGRILTAAGYSGAVFDPARCDIWLGNLMVCAGGTALPFDEAEAKKILQESEILIRIILGEGTAADHIWTCDFSTEYVRINGSYRS
ncbi:MAG: bifunctional glutamate N-acetyltransferase/amino-acid acetyltransferase ArgJ [Bacillota bacterium]|nr:bifunctional glutamate N-acetyltransferase/amino-acid acetyltransferase ArgJ [Bacillota bacterium]